jgi:membrane protease YdiL (CAAX protease family)
VNTPTAHQPRLPATAVVFFYVLLGGGGYLVGRFILDIDPFHPFADRDASPVRDLGIGVAVGLVTVVLSRILDRYFEWSRAMTRMFKDVLGPQRPGDTLVLALASSVGEELLFRGVLLPSLGLVISSLIFGLVHGFAPGRPAEMWATLKSFMPLVIAATAMGFAFGWAVEYTGNILAPIVAHFTINYLNLNEMYRSDWSDSEADDGDG